MVIKMGYLVKTLFLKQKIDEIDLSDKELTESLNTFAEKGYQLERIIPDERHIPSGEGKKVYMLIFKK
jgi:hypothetical protein